MGASEQGHLIQASCCSFCSACRVGNPEMSIETSTLCNTVDGGDESIILLQIVPLILFDILLLPCFCEHMILLLLVVSAAAL